MGLGKLLGIGGGALAEPVEAVGNVLDKLFTSKEEKLTLEQARIKLLQMPSLVNQEINKVEAQHRSVFVAGWRPFIGWVCGTAFLYNYIVRDIIVWIMTLQGYTPEQLPPALQMEHLLTVLTGMLGLGALRSFEKYKKVSK